MKGSKVTPSGTNYDDMSVNMLGFTKLDSIIRVIKHLMILGPVMLQFNIKSGSNLELYTPFHT